MIATGGLLRINARRQDSLRSKPHKSHAQKKKKRQRRSEVVVVKGKLKLCSLSGLVATLGVLVLLVGVAMAALGYWPREGFFFSIQPQEGAARGAEIGEGLKGEPGGHRGDGDCDFNQTNNANGTMQPSPRGFFEDFLDRYLYSDMLKVMGPLIMGIGIFLFICANAVLHENRDRKTKVISLRDIYSTVIDLHGSSSGSAHRLTANPIHGLVNYVQSSSLEVKPRAYPSSLSKSKAFGVPPEIHCDYWCQVFCREVPGGSQAMLLLSCSSLNPSHPSISSLSQIIYCSSSSLALPIRRQSLPTTSLFTDDAGRVQGTPASKFTTSADGFTEELPS
ncbi:transmembrane protein 200C-like [Salarias fasciatus]|uniref:transmembrane protein 200C-like n=1 Tax=Salarias fasciatus TaxID=181472 RepID=UPI0011769BF3|nr:transmembrane protein 200C-like [Salarias fasciatus]